MASPFFDNVVSMPAPANPFPGEPNDQPPTSSPPEPQPGDPGAEPPPADQEPVPQPSDPLSEMIAMVHAQSQADMRSISRLTEALINQLSAGVCTVRMARDTIERLTVDDIKPMLLLADLHSEATALVAALGKHCRQTVN